MNNWKVIFATVVIFGTGVITGGLLVNYAHNSRTRAQQQHKPAAEARLTATNQVARSPEAGKRPPEILSRQFLLQLDAALHLKADQREAIQKIMNEGQNEIRKVVQDSRLEIREVLTPEQQKQFDELVKRPFRKAIFNTNAPAALPSATNAPATNAPAI